MKRHTGVSRRLSVMLTVVTLGIVVWLVARDRPSLEPLLEIHPWQLAAIMILQFMYLVPESFRQEIVIESSSGVALRSVPWFRTFVVGRFLNSIVPQGGNVYRAVRLKADSGVPIADFGGGMATFVIMSVVASLLVAAPLLAWESPSLRILGLPASLVVGVAGLVIAAVPYAAWHLMLQRVTVDEDSSSFARTVHRVVQATATALRDIRLMRSFGAVWIVTIAVVVLLYRYVFDAAGWEIEVGVAIAIYALIQASSFIVVTPGNIGIQEVGMAALAAIFGIPAATGAVAAALIRATGWIAVAIPALVFGSRDVATFLRTGNDRG